MTNDDKLMLMAWSRGLAGPGPAGQTGLVGAAGQRQGPPAELVGAWANASEAQAWILNFHSMGLVGLMDAPRSGRPRSMPTLSVMPGTAPGTGGRWEERARSTGQASGDLEFRGKGFLLQEDDAGAGETIFAQQRRARRSNPGTCRAARLAVRPPGTV